MWIMLEVKEEGTKNKIRSNLSIKIPDRNWPVLTVTIQEISKLYAYFFYCS